MKTYYTGKQAQSYNKTWKVFSAKTHAAICSVIDFAQLEKLCEAREKPPRILDVACGTGLLLRRFAHLISCAELYGVDASQDMLTQASLSFDGQAKVHFVQADLQEGKTASLPYEAKFFDLITCANVLHYIKDPSGVLCGLAELLTGEGQLVIEDYARRSFPFPWRLFEWFIRRMDPQHVRAYTLAEVQHFCQEAGLQVLVAKNFPIDVVWSGWVIRLVLKAPHSSEGRKSGTLEGYDLA